MESYIFLAAGTILGGLIGYFAARAGASAALTENALLKTEAERLRAEALSLTAELRTMAERAAAVEAQFGEFKKEAATREEQARAQFENLARRIFDDNSRRFSEQSKENMTQLLNPVREKFQEFQKLIGDAFGNQAKEQFALKEEIKRIVQVSDTMRVQTESLTKALKGDVKAQGNWGEVILERILEESGLREGIDYILQGAGLSLKAEDGKHQKPDVIVKLPEGKHVVVDAKVSLTHYEQFTATGVEAMKRQFIESVRLHVTGLSSKAYAEQESLASPDFVLMFLPIEGAYSLAMQADPGLHQYAWERKIVLVCPSTLFATLRTIASLWRLELQNRNVQEIARQGGNLYDKFVLFVEDLKSIGDQLERTGKAYKGAMNKLVEGTGNLVARAESLRKLGAKTSKQLPKELLDEEKTKAHIPELEQA